MNNTITIENVWDYLLETEIATEDELRLVTNINGYSIESLNDIIYSKTSYRSLEQLQGLDDE